MVCKEVFWLVIDQGSVPTAFLPLDITLNKQMLMLLSVHCNSTLVCDIDGTLQMPMQTNLFRGKEVFFGSYPWMEAM